MSRASVRSALAQAFISGAFFSSTAIAWENVAFTPPNGSPWARFFFVPSQPAVVTLGTNGADEITGFVQVDLNYPLGTGDGAAQAKYDAMCAVFKAGARFAHGGETVIIRSCGRSQGREIDNTYRVSVTIYFYSQVNR